MTFDYPPEVLRRYREAPKRARLDAPTHSAEEANRVCGDTVRIEMDIVGGTIVGAAFSGDSCALCTAAASLLVESLVGQPPTVALPAAEELAAQLGFGAAPFGRLSCLELPLRATRRALSG